MKIKYQLFEEDNLLVHKFYGKWSTQEYEEYVQFSAKKLNIESVDKILTDLRELETIQPVFDEINHIQNITKKLPISNYINVHLVTDPMLTVASHIYQEGLASEKKIKYNYCSTIKYALELLRLKMTPEELKTLLANLEYQF